jgi:hypothetical protein
MSAGHFASEIFEQRAAAERQRLQNSVNELRSSLTDFKASVKDSVRERVDPNRLARQYLKPLAAGASLLGLLIGYGAAGLFTRR